MYGFRIITPTGVAMKFDLDNLNPSERFYFDDDEKAWIEIRMCAAEDHARIEKESTKVINKPGRAATKVVDEKKKQKLLWDFIITNWGGIEDAKGESIDCTTENKNRLMGGSIRFASFVSDSMGELAERHMQFGEDLEKN